MEKTSVVFLSLKDPSGHGLEHFSENFELDPSIPLPVELPPDPENISREAIIAGMLRVISEGETANVPLEWIDYYRRFVFTVKPEIFHEFTAASVVKARNGEFGMALEINAVLEALFPLSPGVQLNKALILDDRAAFLERNGRQAEKENAEAEQAYETALSLKPVLSDTQFNAGFFFMRRRDFVRAKQCFAAFLKTLEEVGAIDKTEAGKKKQAQKYIKDIESQGLDDAGFREAIENINQGKNEEGLKKIRDFIEKRPKIWNGWFFLGLALRKLGRYSDGLEVFKKTIELGGGNCDVQNEMAICLMELGDLKGAKRELELALRKEPENTKIISNLGVLAMKAGNNEEAAAFFRTVLELDPNDPIVKYYQERFS